MELSIDTASDWASIAVSDEGRLLGEMTWRCERQHSVQLLPSIQALLARLGVDKGDLRRVFVCIGPGGYAGLRVGVSTAKGLAFALKASVVGVGRLEAEAYQFAACGRPICAIHRAGRGEVAWAVYKGPRDGLAGSGRATALDAGSPAVGRATGCAVLRGGGRRRRGDACRLPERRSP